MSANVISASDTRRWYTHRTGGRTPSDFEPEFAMWEMDIVGPLPKATGGREYLLAATDYFTKWIEAVPLAKIREQEVVKFMWEHLICRFGIPYAVITDNGKQAIQRKVLAFCKEHGILQQASTPRYPHHRGTGIKRSSITWRAAKPTESYLTN